MTTTQGLLGNSNDALIDALQKQAEAIQALSKELASLRDHISNNAPKKTVDAQAIPASPWVSSESLKRSINGPENDLLKSMTWRESTPFQNLLPGPRLWLSPGYRLAYTFLSEYLAKATLKEPTRSKVLVRDLQHQWNSISGLLNLENLWGVIGKRGRFDPRKAYSRTILITDLSPALAAMILESTPKIDLTVTAPALERHLTRANYGLVNLYHHGSKDFPGINSYTFEYHLATFYIPQARQIRGNVFQDFRGLRKSSKFGPDVSGPSRWIHEEQLSFILTGHGLDVFTCYQLVDRYFQDPTKKDPVFQSPVFNVLGEQATPAALFLSWLGRALSHVVRRWDLAIDAIDSHIDETFQIIFSETNPDLLSDDPQFSRSKTYFWALQAYKLFDETLSETIEAWTAFRESHCSKLAERPDDPLWQSSVAQIQLRVNRLQDQRAHIRKKVEEVQSLRAGLFGASALFDSRTSLRQNENLRLLTYITLLFLPLSFGTSIFGMQVILPSLPIKVFIITLPSIFVFTTLLVFNLQNMIDSWDAVTSKATSGLRHVMRLYGHRGWPQTSFALEKDRVMLQVPVRKIVRRSSHWAYFAFLLEAPFVLLPVHEISWMIAQVTKMTRKVQFKFAQGVGSKGDENGVSRATRVKIVEEVREATRQQRGWQWPIRFLQLSFAFVRIMAMPIWFLLGALDYAIVLLCFGIFQMWSQTPQEGGKSTPLPISLQPLIWLRLDKALLEAGWTQLARDREPEDDGLGAAKKWKALRYKRIRALETRQQISGIVL